MKTQWPRSADEPGVYMAQTGTGDGGGWRWARPWAARWKQSDFLFFLPTD